MCYGENCVLLIALLANILPVVSIVGMIVGVVVDVPRMTLAMRWRCVGDALAMRWRCMPILCTGEGQREPWPLHTQRYAQD